MGWHVHISSEKKINWMRIMFTWSSVFKPQSFQMDPHYNQYETDTDTCNMNITENHMEFLLPSKKKLDDILQLGWELLFLH